MAINRVVKAALKAISYNDIDIKKNYLLHRNFVNLAHRGYPRAVANAWDCMVDAVSHSIPIRIFSPDEGTDHPVLIFFHGGGWVTGNIDSYSKVCVNMARMTGHKVVSVDYRLAPEHPFPAGLEDCYNVAKLFISNSAINSREVAIIGDSAGGNLAAALSLLARDRKEFHVKKQILIYPATYNDHSDTSPFKSVQDNGTEYLLTSKRIRDYMDLYMSGEGDVHNPYFAPMLAEDLTNQPDTLIITAEFCPLRDEGEYYGKRLRAAGNNTEIYRVKDALHGFFTLPPAFPQVKLSYEVINSFLGVRGEVIE